MVPDTIVALDDIPRLPNGKLNRKALPEPDFEQQRRQDYQGAGSEAEQQIQQIWQEVGRISAFTYSLGKLTFAPELAHVQHHLQRVAACHLPITSGS